jgi:peroxiredoxin
LAPEFALPDLQQQLWHLADGHGQLTVLAFRATWCSPCRAEMPMFANLQKELSAEGVKVIPVAVDEPAKASKFLKQKKLEVWSLVDRSHDVAISYGASAIPKTFLIGRGAMRPDVVAAPDPAHAGFADPLGRRHGATTPVRAPFGLSLQSGVNHPP